jgi:hypothetical protein
MVEKILFAALPIVSLLWLGGGLIAPVFLGGQPASLAISCLLASVVEQG